MGSPYSPLALTVHFLLSWLWILSSVVKGATTHPPLQWSHLTAILPASVAVCKLKRVVR
jgi:hypothetical protein